MAYNQQLGQHLMNKYATALQQQAQAYIEQPSIASAVARENALLRERITALEIENARMTRELVAARTPVVHAVDIVQVNPDVDRIWSALCMAAQT